VLAVSWALMPRPHLWKPFILAASYVFYAAASVKFCFLLAGVALANQAGAQLVHRAPGERRRKQIAAATVAIDLGVLGLFKYYNFFSDDIGSFLDSIHLGLSPPLLSLALPVGLSFWTFQAISYVVDVKRRVIEPGKTIDVALYLSFFPHVVAGPIVRAREFLPQLQTPRDPRDVAVGPAVVLIGIGLVKKVAIADFLARSVVDPVFGVPQAYHAQDVALAAYGYAAQIYCDFSGYTDIAIGVALLMGIVFPRNFNSPYRATSFRDFWRRWHITLSRFLRDFLYIPLGGNRHGNLQTARNIMITMLLGGLWHGAAWGFILWGGLHGVGLVVERQLRGRVSAPAWLRWAIVFNLVVLGWVLFRSESISLAGTFLSRLADPGPATLWTFPVVLAIVATVGLQLLPPRPLDALRLRAAQLSPAALGTALALVIAFVGATVPSQAVPPFIYFQF
jgi:D-alanyl-lipoteichoic acid acyltransferase DltB (MBOAT superfamily)